MTINTLMNWLELEHEALWTLPVIAARVSERRAACESAMVRHSDVVRRIRVELARLNVEAPAPQPSYGIGPVTSVDDADAVLRVLADRITAATLAHAGESHGEELQWTLIALAESARDVVTFGGEPEALPGLR